MIRHSLRLIAVIFLSAFALVAGVATANAAPGTGTGSPHFVRASAAINDAGQLVVNFTEAGLGNAQTATVQVTADYTATWACRNNGGGWAPGLRTSVGTVAESGTFTADRNGRIIASLTAPQIWPPEDITCPNGQSGPFLVSVSYSNITITDVTNGVSVSLADLSRTLITLGKSARN
jgi:hypothetical protein